MRCSERGRGRGGCCYLSSKAALQRAMASGDASSSLSTACFLPNNNESTYNIAHRQTDALSIETVSVNKVC